MKSSETVERLKAAHENELRVLRDFQRRESERANRNGEYASNVEVALMVARSQLKRIEKALSDYENDEMNQRRMIAEVWSALADGEESPNLTDARHTLETTTAGLEEVARRHGWSEEVNCSPWAWLDNEIARLQEQMTVEQLMGIAKSSDVLIFAGHVLLCRDVKLTTGCVRCGREWNEAEVCLRETCDGPELTTERLIAALYGEDGESSDD
jgi:hypothetical protein